MQVVSSANVGLEALIAEIHRRHGPADLLLLRCDDVLRFRALKLDLAFEIVTHFALSGHVPIDLFAFVRHVRSKLPVVGRLLLDGPVLHENTASRASDIYSSSIVDLLLLWLGLLLGFRLVVGVEDALEDAMHCPLFGLYVTLNFKHVFVGLDAVV